ncbi:MAG: HD domain-containing protein [Deltaproteobacteria bacterium]|nr:MAG: HD domain-containing protein [Deltaproteobacteria bacterium]
MKTVGFTRMEDGTREDYLFLARLKAKHDAGAADRVFACLEGLREGPSGYQVDRYEHSLQTATRALRAGADEELVVCALLHDIGDNLAPHNHAAFAAEVLRPYVSNENYWLVEKHGIFQGYYFWHHYGLDRHAREKYRGHPCFERTALFCERWDQPAFDPDYDTLPLEAFEPMLRRIFAREPFSHAQPSAS